MGKFSVARVLKLSPEMLILETFSQYTQALIGWVYTIAGYK